MGQVYLMHFEPLIQRFKYKIWAELFDSDAGQSRVILYRVLFWFASDWIPEAGSGAMSDIALEDVSLHARIGIKILCFLVTPFLSISSSS